ncbi:MAG: hypothetical protein JJT85_01890 [Chromatiales bacterium]|nr:hypothetical protein [Chromatiales bacterium]
MHYAVFNAVAGVVAVAAVAAVSVGYDALDRGQYAEVVEVRRVTTTVLVAGHDCDEQPIAGTCQPTAERRIESPGYYVTYLLDGQQRVVRLDHDPGKRLLVEDGRLILQKLRTLQ